MEIFSNKVFTCFIKSTIYFIIIILITVGKTLNVEHINTHENSGPYIEKIIIQHGDFLASTLNNTKLSIKDSNDIIEKLKKNLNLNINYCKPGDFYEILYNSKTGKWTDFLYYPSDASTSYYSITRSPNGNILAEKKELDINISEHRGQGTITSSLWTAMISQNIPPDIVVLFADIFAWQIDFLTDTKNGDIFKVIYRKKQISKKNGSITPEIIAAQYKTSSKIYNAFYFKTKKGTCGYFNENGKSVRSAFLKAPLQFRRISSHFTTSRFHPILKYTRPHLGIDYAAPTGTPVSSISDGVIIKAQYSGGFGNLVIVKHLNAYETYYGHLSRYGKGIKKNVRINQGQVIGYVGMTGLATGPHLDFRIKLNGKFFDFLKMKQPPMIILTGEDKKKFKEKAQIFINRFKLDQ